MRLAGTRSANPSAFADRPSGSRNSARNISPGDVVTRSGKSSMIIDDFDIRCFSILPAEANPPLIVNPDRPLPDTIALQFLEPVARWHPQILDCRASINLIQFPHSDRDYRGMAPRLARPPKFYRLAITNTTYHIIRKT